MRRTLAVSLAMLFVWAAPGRPADDDDFDDIEIGNEEDFRVGQDPPGQGSAAQEPQGGTRGDGDRESEAANGGAGAGGGVAPRCRGRNSPRRGADARPDQAADRIGRGRPGPDRQERRWIRWCGRPQPPRSGRIGPGAKLASPSLLAALKDSQPGPRAAAAEALGLINAEPEETIPLLIDALADSDRSVRLNVVTALGRFGGKAARAAGELGEVVTKDKVPGCPQEGGRVPVDDWPAREGGRRGLAEALQKDTILEVRRWSAIALGKIGPDAKDSAPCWPPSWARC